MNKLKSTKLKFLILILIVMLIAWLIPTSFVYGVELPHIEASLTNDWIGLWNFATEVDVDIFINGAGPYTVHTDDGGHARFEGAAGGINLIAGMIITAGSKELVLVPLSLDAIDWDENTIGGTGPASAWISVNAGNDSGGHQMEVMVDANGNWSVDFDDDGFDITDDMWAQALFFDEDGDATVAEPMPPHIEASLTNDWIGLWGFEPGESVVLTIVGGWSDTVTTDGEGHYLVD